MPTVLVELSSGIEHPHPKDAQAILIKHCCAVLTCTRIISLSLAIFKIDDDQCSSGCDCPDRMQANENTKVRKSERKPDD